MVKTLPRRYKKNGRLAAFQTLDLTPNMDKPQAIKKPGPFDAGFLPPRAASGRC
jgi:hypothetical protein